MAMNSFNPRLFSSSSSENDVDEMFRRKGASVVPVGGTLPTAKSRCFSEPVYQLGKEVVKEDPKTQGKTPALSDSSNVLRRQRGRIVSQPIAIENPSVCEAKNDCSAVVEENIVSTNTDSVFPEPESNREAAKDAYRFSILLEEEETMDEMIPHLGQRQDLGDTGLVEFSNDVDTEGMGIGAPEDDVFYMRDVAFGSINGNVGVHTEGQHLLDDNDDSYPDKEYIPSGYISYATRDLPFVSYPWELPRTVLPSYADSSLGKMPELPDDLFKETDIYPVEMDNDFENLSPVLLPSTPFAPPDYDLKMKVFFGESVN